MTSREGRRGGRPPRGLQGLNGVVSLEVLHALEVSSDALRRLGVPHAVVGALAVGFHGHPRATKDVDFLVGPDALVVSSQGITSLATGIPIKVDDVQIDVIHVDGSDGELLAEEFDPNEDIPFISLRGLFFMKLVSGRRQDKADLSALLKNMSDAEIDEVRDWIDDEDLVADLDRLVEDL